MQYAFACPHALIQTGFLPWFLSTWLDCYALIDSCGILGTPLSWDVPWPCLFRGAENLCHIHLGYPVWGMYIWLNWTNYRFLLMLFLRWESSLLLHLASSHVSPNSAYSVTSELLYIFQEPAYTSTTHETSPSSLLPFTFIESSWREIARFLTIVSAVSSPGP